jgi:hypothetical protein
VTLLGEPCGESTANDVREYEKNVTLPRPPHASLLLCHSAFDSDAAILALATK